MAGYGSNRDLWHFITGSYVRRPPELIAEELKKNRAKLLKGVSFYEKPGNKSDEKFQRERKVKGVQLEFINKLSKFLQLDETQSHDIFRLYLLQDYRGSQKELQRLLAVDRHAQALILKVRDYYFSERLCLLRCLKHLFSFWQDPKHPYESQYAAFVEEVADNEKFIIDIVSQYISICDEQAPTWEVNGNAMNERQASIWLTQNLKEQCELLEIVLLFYKDYMHPGDAYAVRAALFKKQGFGRRQTNKHMLDETFEPMLHRIGYLQVAILIEGADLDFLLKCHENNCVKEHPIVKSSSFKVIDHVFSSLGDSIQHGPILLMWAVVRHLALGSEGAAITRKLGNQALSLNVFTYLLGFLNSEPFNGKSCLALVGNSVVYNLLCTVLGIFHEETLGDTEGVYAVAAKVLKEPAVCDDFWHRDLSDGLGLLLQSAQQRFPLDFIPLLQLSTSLASNGTKNADIVSNSLQCGEPISLEPQRDNSKIVAVLERQPVYMEFFEKNRIRDLKSTENDDVWQLLNDKKPYNSDLLIIPRGSFGVLINQAGKGGQLIQWGHTYDTFSLFKAETASLLLQVAQGANSVSSDSVSKVTAIARLTNALLTVDGSKAALVSDIIDMMCPVIQRFCLLAPPPLELLSAALDTVRCVAKAHPEKVWHGVQQTGLPPYLTENFDTLAEYATGAGLNAGAYGSILAGYECTHGRYPVTISLLKLVEQLVKPLHEAGKLDSLTAFLLFMGREIFPVFGKWRYYEPSGREEVGQLCLQIFHRVLNTLSNDREKPTSGVSVRDLCVYSLLFTESGRTLLDIISTGVDNIEIALSQQGSVTEGAGTELIKLIRLAFSVLNRLLLLRPSNSLPSPVEHALSTQPANRAHRHVVATIAQYVYHRHDMRLPTLATLLLKRLAMIFPMSILACLGNEAEAIRDMYLARLAARTEDIRLKVVILELLAVCVDTQPGLTEMYLNVQPAPLSSSTSTPASKSGTSTPDVKDKKDLSLGRTSCLITVLDLIEESKQGTYQCPPDLLCAALQFLHALWYGRRETALAVLREKPTFWTSVCLSLMRDLSRPKEVSSNSSIEALERDVKSCAHIFRILAQELYAVPSSELDENLKKVIKELVSEKRMEYWSRYLKEKLETCNASYEHDEELADDGTLHLLLAWRSLILVLAVHKPACFTLGNDVKNQILSDILAGLKAQFANDMNKLNVKLASISSAFYFTVVKHWKGSVKEWREVLEQLHDILLLTESLIPSIQIGIFGSLTVALQHLRVTILKDVDGTVLRPLVPVVCSVLQQSTYQLYPLRKKDKGNEKEQADVLDAKLKLQVVNIVLLEELITSLDGPDEWLPPLTEHSIFASLLSSLQTWIDARQGIQYVNAALSLLVTISTTSTSAEALALNGLTHSLCLSVNALLSEDKPSINNPQLANADSSADSVSWTEIYHRYLVLNTCMLTTLRYNFLQDALNFMGVHQDRMRKTLDGIRLDLSPRGLSEVIDTCRFLAKMAEYRREWRLHLPDVLNMLMTSLCYLSHTCVSMLMRPLVLQHILEKKSGKERSQKLSPEKLTMTPVTKRLSSQSSIEETDGASPEVLRTQHDLLLILSECLTAMRRFSPELCEILLDQSMDVGEFDPILQVSFNSPSMDADSAPTFGTMITATNKCLRLLTRLEPKVTSPSKSPKSGEMPLKRSTILYVMENALWLMMSQAVRYLREANFPPRDKQLLKRELSAELNSFLSSMQRHFRRGSTSPANTTLMSPGSANKSLAFTSSGEQAYFKLVDGFMKNVLR